MKRLHVSLMAAVFLIMAGAVLAQAQQPYQEGSMTQQSATDPQPSTTPQQPAATTPSSSAPADQPSTTTATQTDPSTTPTSTSTSMPKTASPLPLVGLGGLFALAGGLLIRPRRTA
jgi:MYXO-CTERM domain-containing protein